MTRQPGPDASLLHQARKGRITDEMTRVARDEGLEPDRVRDLMAKGRLVIPANVNHQNLIPAGIGRDVTVKVNANIGNSPLGSSIQQEVEKVVACMRYGAHAVMDLSTGKDINEIRAAIIEASRLPVGTVPIYQAMEMVPRAEDLNIDLMLKVIETQAKQGVDFMTLHTGILWQHLPLAARRVTGIVSRGGAIMARWMMHHKAQNFMYEHFDRILDICARYDVTISLGDGLRPGCIADASDEAQFAELDALGELVTRCWERDVQVMVEGPGHVPFEQIAMNMQRQQQVCHDAPFYVLGPVVTDIAPGYDHITSAIGATMAAYSGASFLCYVTPKEHLGLPELEDVRQGIIAYRIAAHAADIALKKPGADRIDLEMAKARFAFDWERQFSLAMDPDRAREYFDANQGAGEHFHTRDYCTMCGPKFCAMRIYQKGDRREDG